MTERGLRRCGYLLTRVMALLALVVFSVNIFPERPPVGSLLFAIALAVGMSPELLPAIISVTLASGARVMAGRGVIVRRLDAIENLGAMEVFCTDKTGTLTEGAMAIEGAVGPAGQPSQTVLCDACTNAALQTGLPSARGRSSSGRRGPSCRSSPRCSSRSSSARPARSGPAAERATPRRVSGSRCRRGRLALPAGGRGVRIRVAARLDRGAELAITVGYLAASELAKHLLRNGRSSSCRRRIE